ncbi:MAG: gamma-glutamylcyclotransferase [Gammaproteobacteria bacterium]|nr:gamma-glutamylcyclotransferase [Gammaproteobacteria bacterium]
MEVNYFAFGSNLSSPRLLERIPRASKHCVATLPGHRLCWHKRGQDRSGKCDIAASDNPNDIVYGVVYLMTQDEKLQLDVHEGAGIGYERREVTVSGPQGVSINAFTYYALEIDHLRQPYHWYKEHVLRGALEHGFPEDYIETIRATPSIDDHDAERHWRELVIYETDG